MTTSLQSLGVGGSYRLRNSVNFVRPKVAKKRYCDRGPSQCLGNRKQSARKFDGCRMAMGTLAPPSSSLYSSLGQHAFCPRGPGIDQTHDASRRDPREAESFLKVQPVRFRQRFAISL